jgi:hypothetical protein
MINSFNQDTEVTKSCKIKIRASNFINFSVSLCENFVSEPDQIK